MPDKGQGYGQNPKFVRNQEGGITVTGGVFKGDVVRGNTLGNTRGGGPAQPLTNKNSRPPRFFKARRHLEKMGPPVPTQQSGRRGAVSSRQVDVRRVKPAAPMPGSNPGEKGGGSGGSGICRVTVMDGSTVKGGIFQGDWKPPEAAASTAPREPWRTAGVYDEDGNIGLGKKGQAMLATSKEQYNSGLKKQYGFSNDRLLDLVGHLILTADRESWFPQQRPNFLPNSWSITGYGSWEILNHMEKNINVGQDGATRKKVQGLKMNHAVNETEKKINVTRLLRTLFTSYDEAIPPGHCPRPTSEDVGL